MPAKEETEKRDHDPKLIFSLYGMIIGWVLTLAGFIWTVASKDTQYGFRLDTIERELINLDERLDAAESFRMEIRSDLAEIKTDLLWIRKELQNN